jgi:hypothetical protein
MINNVSAAVSSSGAGVGYALCSDLTCILNCSHFSEETILFSLLAALIFLLLDDISQAYKYKFFTSLVDVEQ